MNNKQDFTQGSIFGKMIQFMFPILGALVLQAMYGAVDMLVVGHFGTNAGISAVSTGSSIMNLLTFVLNALAPGVTILLGKYLGEKRNDQIGSLIGNAISFFLIFFAITGQRRCLGGGSGRLGAWRGGRTGCGRGAMCGGPAACRGGGGPGW